MVLDITQRKQSEKKRASQSLLIEELSHRLVQAHEQARRRFSRELHDRTSPNLAALRINLDIITQASAEVRASAAYSDRIEDTRALIKDTTLSVRDICAELHPPALDAGGLLGVVQSYAQPFAKRTGLQVRVQCPHDEVRLAPSLELALFRIVQEALTNCAKHACAKVVLVRLQLDSSPKLLSVLDDGAGFELEPHDGVLQSRGQGLRNMKETAEFVGGRFGLESVPGRGTRVFVEL
jgi:two-component system CheB/CheR fusion protein